MVLLHRPVIYYDTSRRLTHSGWSVWWIQSRAQSLFPGNITVVCWLYSHHYSSVVQVGGGWNTHRAFLAGVPPLVPLHLQWGHQLETSSPPHFIPSPGTFVDLFHCQKLARHAETQPGRLLEYSTDGSSVTAHTGCERLQFCIVTVRAGHWTWIHVGTDQTLGEAADYWELALVGQICHLVYSSAVTCSQIC